MIFCGEFVRVIDGKWRFSIPKNFKEKLGEIVYFYLAENKEIRIYSSAKEFKKEECPFAYEEKIDSQGRIMIPKEIREKISFYSSKVNLIGYKEYIVIRQII